MNEIYSFKTSTSPAYAIAKAVAIIEQNKPSEYIKKIEEKADGKRKFVLYKSDYGLIHNCSVRVSAMRNEDEATIRIIIEGCACERMQGLYRKLRDEL